MLLQQFLVWWSIYFIFMCTLILIMPSHGEEKMPLNLLITTIECTALGSIMAISHYYMLYKRFFAHKKHLIYFILTACFIGLFIFFDFILFRLQVGPDIFKNRPNLNLYISSERVMHFYVPVVLVYAFFRNQQLKRKEKKNNANFAAHF